MPSVSLKALKDKRMPASVKFAGVTINFEYRPGMVDSTHDTLLNQGMRDEANEKIYEGMCRALASWDLVGDDDQPIALTPEAMTEAELPTPLMTMILNKYQEEARNGSLQAKK